MDNIFKANSIPLANTIEDIGIIMQPIEELNSLFILSPKKVWLDMVIFWKNKLDVVSKVSDTPRYIFMKQTI